MREPFCKECGNHGERARLTDLGNGTYICRWKSGCEDRIRKEKAKLARLAGNMDELARLNETACPNCGSTEPHYIHSIDPETGQVVGSQFWAGDGSHHHHHPSQWSPEPRPLTRDDLNEAIRKTIEATFEPTSAPRYITMSDLVGHASFDMDANAIDAVRRFFFGEPMPPKLINPDTEEPF